MPALRDEPAHELQALTELGGTVLGSRYELGRALGAGGMGAVFEGKDQRLGRAVAIKVMRPDFAIDGEYTKRFLREAQAASRIRHRNVVVILDYGQAQGGLLYSVMELLAGQDLEEHLRGQPEQRLPWVQALGLLVQVASGLRAAHAQGIVHRDIKPANCFLTTEDDEPVVKVVDFGIAKLDDAAQTQQLTRMGDLLGTPSYIAPELVQGSHPVSPRSDVYSLGAVAYRMLTGRLPFTGSTVFEVMFRACKDRVPPLREQVPELPAAVEELVLAMLAKEPEARPADMGEVRQRLQALERGAHGAATVEAPGTSRDEPGTAEVREATRTAMLDAVPGARPERPQRIEPTEALELVVNERAPHPPRELLRAAAASGRPAVADATLHVEPAAGSERPPRGTTRALVVTGVFVVLGIGGVAWSLSSDEKRPEARATTPSRRSDADAAKPGAVERVDPMAVGSMAEHDGAQVVEPSTEDPHAPLK